MTVIVKDKAPLVIPPAVRRRAGYKGGDELEFKVSGGVVTIVPKLPPDDLADYLELRDPKVRAHIRKSRAEFLTGKSRPAESFFARRAARAKDRSGKKRRPRT